MARLQTTVGPSLRPGMHPAWPPPARAAAWPCHALALVLVLAVGALRWWYLAYDCPFDLSPDEAHYWDWARHLDWSYYSKGPGVAWLIAASTAVFGDVMWAVRLPAVACGSLTLLGLYVLTWQVHRSEHLAVGGLLLALTVPTLAVGGLLMTIDAPYVCCWTWALVVALQAVRHPAGRGAWLALGLLVGAGILFKYTMVLFLPSLGLYFLARRLRLGAAGVTREHLAGIAITCLAAGLCCVPIVIWNAQHDWVTLRHVGRQAGVQGQPAWLWLGPLEYLAGQFGVLLGFWFVGWAAAMTVTLVQWLRQPAGVEPRTADDRLFLWCLSVPMFLTFLAFSFKTKVQVNWPVTAYLSGAVLLAGWLAAQCSSPRGWQRRLARGTVAAAALLGLAATVLLHHTEWLYPAVAPSAAVNMRRWDPSCRLRGWQTLAAEVDRVRGQLRAEGIEPVLAASNWNLPGVMAFYLPDHPTVYSLARASGGRHSQYDFWRPNPQSDPAVFAGCTVLYVGLANANLEQAFAAVEPTRWVQHEVHGHVVAAWPITVCRGFRGFQFLAADGY